MWQVGFWHGILPKLKKEPKVIGTVSAGAAMVCCMYADAFDRAYEFFLEAAERNRKNFYFTNLFRKGRPAFPHTRIYRSALLHAITDKGFRKLKKGPEIRIMISRPPRGLGARLATVVGIGAYSLEKIISGPVHPLFGKKLGFKHEMYRAADCSSREELTELILASSCTPPFTPLMRWKGAPSLDGGLVDNVPVDAVHDVPGNSLVLLTRKYPMNTIPSLPDRMYIQPEIPVPISKWDYTNPDGIRSAYEQGRREGERFTFQM